MKDILNRFFKRQSSKEEAKQRLKFQVIHDQVDLTPAQLDQMKDEMLAVITKYVEIDATETELRLERSDDTIALVSSVPVQRVIARPVIAT